MSKKNYTKIYFLCNKNVNFIVKFSIQLQLLTYYNDNKTLQLISQKSMVVLLLISVELGCVWSRWKSFERLTSPKFLANVVISDFSPHFSLASRFITSSGSVYWSLLGHYAKSVRNAVCGAWALLVAFSIVRCCGHAVVGPGEPMRFPTLYPVTMSKLVLFFPLI